MSNKPCSWCGVEKHASEYSLDRTQKSGLSPRCKLCQKNPDPAIRVQKAKKGCLTAYCKGKPVRENLCRKCSDRLAIDNLFSVDKWMNHYIEKGWIDA